MTRFNVGDEVIITGEKFKGKNIYLAEARIINITKLIHFEINIAGVWVACGAYKEDCFTHKHVYNSPLYKALS